MDNPFVPALICFVPFFVILFIHLLTRGRQKPRIVSPKQLAVAVIISLGLSVVGLAGSLILHYSSL